MSALVTAGAPVPVDGAVARELVRVAREALTNIVRHAAARTVRLGLLYEPATVSLLVQDDGQGFAAVPGWPEGRYGLRALAEQARELGGSVEVDSVPGWGTRIRARFPCARAPPRGPRPPCACCWPPGGRCSAPGWPGC